MGSQDAKDAINKVGNKQWPIKYTLGAAAVLVVIVWALIKLVF